MQPLFQKEHIIKKKDLLIQELLLAGIEQALLLAASLVTEFDGLNFCYRLFFLLYFLFFVVCHFAYLFLFLQLILIITSGGQYWKNQNVQYGTRKKISSEALVRDNAGGILRQYVSMIMVGFLAASSAQIQVFALPAGAFEVRLDIPQRQ